MVCRTLNSALAEPALAVVGCLYGSSLVRAEPGYPLHVKPNPKPAATLQLGGERPGRSAVKDDPGFRLQYPFKEEGNSLATPEDRAQAIPPVPQATP